VFGEPSFFPNDIEAVWTLGDGQMVYIVEHSEAGHSVVTIMVDDLDARLASIDVEPAVRETYDNGVRKVTFKDPDGNEVAFGSVPPV
jgi:hypothetical protein